MTNGSRRSSASFTSEEHGLGMQQSGITRRDFLGGVVLGSGAALLGQPAPAGASTSGGVAADGHSELMADDRWFNGYGGIGEYRSCNGNTWEVIQAAHQIRDGLDNAHLDKASATEEHFDVVIVGAGASGLGAAFHFNKETAGRKRCLILDDHPVFGGEAKQNEFIVNGHRLIAPQGSNVFLNAPEPTPMQMYTELREIGMPVEFEYGRLIGTRKALKFDISNYMFQWIADEFESNGFFFGSDSTSDYVVEHNAWAKNLANAPWPDSLKQDMLRWKYEITPPDDETIRRFSGGKSYERWMDSITYKYYVTEFHGLDPAVTRWADPLMASASGFGASTASAFAAVSLMHMYGGRTQGLVTQSSQTFDIEQLYSGGHVDCFPSGNGGLARYFVNHLIPGSIAGSGGAEDVICGKINFDRLDAKNQSVRLRLGATALRVRHIQRAGQRAQVEVVYEHGGKLNKLIAPEAIMCGGGWANRRVVGDLPARHREAYSKFHYAPFIVANVALTNWRFLERAGMTSCIYTHGDFGFSCNIRRPMHIGNYRPPLHPSKPIVLTFYAPIYYDGLSAQEQGARGRSELLGTPYKDLELRIRKQMMRLFGNYGLDPVRDIAGIIVNRWGHAYVVSAPGMVVGDDCNPTPGDVLRAGHDYIKFAHSDLSGFQAYARAVAEGRRAARQVCESL